MNADQPHSESHGQARLGIIGLGLLGGSIARAAKERGLVQAVIAVGRDARRLQQAHAAGLIDEGGSDVSILRGCDLVIICTPVDRVAADAQRVTTVLQAPAIITDVGSVKDGICHAVPGVSPSGARFVGSHPLAGSEKNGWEHSRADLFDGRPCVVTPTPQTDREAVQRVRTFWEALGMRTSELSPARHDELLAATSHVPHIAAAMVAALLDTEAALYASTGFRDTTRVAAGDPDLWTPILLENPALPATLDRLAAQLDRFRTAVRERSPTEVRALLEEGRRHRALYREG